MRILVVDDDRNVLRALEVVLRRSRFACRCVETGEEALRVAAEEPFDLVLLDVGLPDLDGKVVCRRLKAACENFLPVIMVTGHDETEGKVEGLESGADDYLVKPFDNRELVARIKALLRIKHLHDELRRNAKVRQQIVYTVSHDFRTPLAGIRGAIQNLLNGLVGDVPPEQKEYLQLVDEATQRLLAMVDEMCHVARRNERSGRVDKEAVDLRKAVETALSGLRPEIAKRKLHVEMDVAIEAPPAYGDQAQIVQVLANLLDNAVKHSPDGSPIRVHIGREVGRKGTFAHVVVADRGPGIARSDHERIFYRFEQVGDPETRKAGGTGLGLAICRETVQAHGGRIWVESEPGAGAAFHVALPTVAPVRGSA